MTILAETPYWIAEYDHVPGVRQLTICDKWTGRGKAILGGKIAGDFRDCLKTHSAEQTIRTWLKIMRNQPWHQIYKPMALVLSDLSRLSQ